MHPALAILAVGFLLAMTATATAAAPDDGAEWTLYVTNDNCPDYTWGFTEEQTRKAFADVVRGHLDEMKRTDDQPPENQDRYNAAVTQEVLCFVEHYPQRKDELIRRIREGRLYVSPYLCNSLWGFQGVEGAIRTFYPARRLEREWGIRCFDWAEHIEEPSLPWGTATILAGCRVFAPPPAAVLLRPLQSRLPGTLPPRRNRAAGIALGALRSSPFSLAESQSWWYTVISV